MKWIELVVLARLDHQKGNFSLFMLFEVQDVQRKGLAVCDGSGYELGDFLNIFTDYLFMPVLEISDRPMTYL